MKIEQPPATGDQIASRSDAYKHFANPEIMKLARRANYEYWYWTELKNKPLPAGVLAADVWAIVKLTRNATRKNLEIAGVPGCRFHYQVTEPTAEKLHRFDLYMGGILQTEALIPADDKSRYLLSSLMEEAIASSQLPRAK